jgi:hypothetical protein
MIPNNLLKVNSIGAIGVNLDSRMLDKILNKVDSIDVPL